MTYSTKQWKFSKKDCPNNERHKWIKDTENPKWGGELTLIGTTITWNYWLKWEILSSEMTNGNMHFVIKHNNYMETWEH
jgi:hypothetical protein